MREPDLKTVEMLAAYWRAEDALNDAERKLRARFTDLLHNRGGQLNVVVKQSDWMVDKTTHDYTVNLIGCGTFEVETVCQITEQVIAFKVDSADPAFGETLWIIYGNRLQRIGDTGEPCLLERVNWFEWYEELEESDND